MSRKISTKRIVIVSFLVDLFDILSNFVVAILTGSAVIFAEMIQGVTDSLGSLLLVIGQRRARLPSDSSHPFGHSREVFFWALLSSLVMLLLGSGLSILRGYSQLINPEEIRHKWLALGILLVSVATNGYALSQSYHKIKVKNVSLVRSFHESGNQLVKTALLRDSLGTLSAVIGLIAIFLYEVLNVIILDALGAIVIGILLAVFALLLITQAKNLITGQAVPRKVLSIIRKSTEDIPEVIAVNRLAAVYTGSEQILVDLDVDLKEKLTTTQIEAVLDKIQSSVKKRAPQAKTVRIDLNSPTMHEEIKIEKLEK